MKNFHTQVNEWQDSTFPWATADSVIAHLKREIKELDNDRTPEEAADCLLLLIGFANKSGFNLFEEAEKKFRILLDREWAAPDEEGVSEHERCPACKSDRRAWHNPTGNPPLSCINAWHRKGEI